MDRWQAYQNALDEYETASGVVSRTMSFVNLLVAERTLIAAGEASEEMAIYQERASR